MKTFYLSISLALISLVTITAQAPNAFAYQAVIRNASGAAVANQDISIRTRIRQNSISGANVFTEVHDVNTNAYGQVTLSIGEGTPSSGSFSAIKWGEFAYFIEVAVDLTGGTSYQIISTTQLLSVPYAQYANVAGDLQNVRVSATGDTLYLSSTTFVIIPGISLAQNNDWEVGEPWLDPRDNHEYATVQIGNQIWMAENLNYGTRIASNLDMADNEVFEKYCYENNELYCDTFGALYQWNEMMNYNPSSETPVQGLCPAGWHIPTLAERDTLVNFLGGLTNAGAELAASGTDFWNDDFGTNLYGFNALGSGRRRETSSGTADLKNQFYMWFSQENPGTPGNGYFLRIVSNTVAAQLNHSDKRDGYSVRCIKD